MLALFSLYSDTGWVEKKASVVAAVDQAGQSFCYLISFCTVLTSLYVIFRPNSRYYFLNVLTDLELN